MSDPRKTEPRKNDSRNPGSLPEDGKQCARWEAALVDLLDGTLPVEEAAAFHEHARSCQACETLLRESGTGRDWARLLHAAPPAVPEALLGRILASTAGARLPAGVEFGREGSAPLLAGGDALLPAASWSLRGQRQTRLLMTGAMAFFSLALTLSVSGVKVDHLHDLHDALRAPLTLEMTASRQFYDTKKQVVSFYDNLRLVHEVESTVEDLRNARGTQSEGVDGKRHVEPSAHRRPLLPLSESGSSLLARREGTGMARSEKEAIL